MVKIIMSCTAEFKAKIKILAEGRGFGSVTGYITHLVLNDEVKQQEESR